MMKTPQRIALFDSKMNGIVTNECRDWLIKNGFFTAPASTKFHGAYEGGLFDHCYAVTKALEDLTYRLDLSWWRPESPFLVGMFHDLCKIDQYEHPAKGLTMDGKPIYDTSKWIYRENPKLKGHGDKSIMLLSMFTFLTEEEVMCIRYHMGAFTDKEEWRFYSGACHEFPNVLWTHTADMLASQVQKV